MDVRIDTTFTRLRRKPRLPVPRSNLLRRMDESVEECGAGFPRSFGGVSPKAQQGPRLSCRVAPKYKETLWIA